MRDRIQLSRVATIFDSFEEAKNYLKSKKDILRDGEGLLARYVDPNNKEIKTALGICYVDHPGFGQKNHVTVFMGDFDNLIMEMVHEYLEHAQIEGNGRITITQDGNTIGTFKVNDFNDTTIDLDLTSFISNTVNDLVNYYTKDETYTKEEVNSLIVTPNIGEGLLTINFNSTKAGEFNANQMQDATININETDPTVPAHVKSITQEDITNWNEGAANVIEHIKKNNVELPITDKTVNIEVPTSTSQLTNDSNFITLADIPDQAQADWNQVITTAPDYIKNKPTVPSNTSELNNDSGFITYNTESLLNYYRKSETYNKDEVNALIASIEHFHWEVYPTLQDIQDPQSNVLYLIGPTGAGPDKYEEYVYSNGTFVKIGETTIDLSNYYTKSETYNKTEVDTAINNAVKNGKLNITFNGVDKGDFYANQGNNTFVVLAEEDPTVPSHVKSITQQNINNWNNSQPNVIEEVQVNGTPLPVSNKSVNVVIPAPTPAVVVDNDATLDWNTRTDVGSVDGTSIHVTMPANPNTDTQADWNEADTTSPAYINNKPTNLSDFNNDVVNDNTITIKTNGTTVDSFTTNNQSNKDIDIPLPTNLSDLNNDLVNDNTITIKTNGTTVDSFTTNNSSNKDIDIPLPTNLSDLNNDVVNDNTITIQTNGSTVDSFTTNAQQGKTINIPVPANLSDLNNDVVNDNTITIQTNGSTVDSFTTNAQQGKTINIPIPSNLTDLNNDLVNDNTITIQTNGSTVDSFTTNASQGKTINIPVPTNTSDLNNDSGFITNLVNDLTNYYTKSQTYTQAEVDALIGGISSFTYEIYPTTSSVTNPQSNVLYLIGPTGSGADKYEEYVYSNNTWVKIGDTSIDLSGYVQTTDLHSVAFSGDYNSLINRPSIPTVNDGILTINSQDLTQWRTISKDEFDYILNGRRGDNYAKCLIDNQYNCLVLIPDGEMTSLNSPNTPSAAFNSNSLTLAQARNLEAQGYVFLPLTYYRDYDTTLTYADGYYWTSTDNNGSGYVLNFNSGTVALTAKAYNYGHGVRLVTDSNRGLGYFTINLNEDTVSFAPGNLQYQASTNTWQFALTQWEALLNNAGNNAPAADRATQSEWVDLFGWGCDGYNEWGVTAYEPYEISTTNNNYYHGDLDATVQDWGYAYMQQIRNVQYQFTANQSGNTSLNLSAVAISGDYNDLKNKPESSAPNDSQITLQTPSGEWIGGFTTNSDYDVDITIKPENVQPKGIYEGTIDTLDNNNIIVTGDCISNNDPFVVKISNCDPSTIYTINGSNMLYNETDGNIGDNGATPFYSGTVDEFELTLTPVLTWDIMTQSWSLDGYRVIHFSYIGAGGGGSTFDWDEYEQ